MSYPLISEYTEAILSAEDNFAELSYLRPVLDDFGRPIMSSGNFAVVYKMRDPRDGKFYAVKCFTRDQEGRDKAYKKICNELQKVQSKYLVQISYYEAELFVDSSQTTETEFPVVLMEWIDGLTLDKYIFKFKGNPFALYEICFNFRNMACWLVSQPFAHGDIKPDNVLVQNDGNIVLVDYDGMYVSTMHGESSREHGTPDYCNPFKQTEFNAHMDDYALAVLSLSIKLISISFNVQKLFPTNGNGLLISKEDVLNLENSPIFTHIRQLLTSEPNLSLYYSTFIKCLGCTLSQFDFDNNNEKHVEEMLQFWPECVHISNKDKIECGILDSNGVVYTKDGTGVIAIIGDRIPEDREIFINEGVIFFYEDSMSYDLPKIKLHLPSSLRYFNRKSLNYKYSSINWASPWFTYYNGFVYTEDLTEAILKHINDAQLDSKTLVLGSYLFSGMKFNGIWPDNLQRIRNSSFKNASVPNVFKIPEGVITIGKRGSAHCSATEILLPKSLKYIDDFCFHMCDNLTHVVFDTDCKLETISNSSFANNKSLYFIKLPSNLKRIGQNAFTWCKNIQTIEFPTKLEIIDTEAFSMNELFGNDEDSKLRELAFPPSLKKIGKNAFTGCNQLTKISFSSKIENIEENAFSKCINLTDLNHSGIEFIGKGAFAGCRIVFNSLENIEDIEHGALTGCSILSVGNSPYCIKKDCLYTIDYKQLIYSWSTEEIIEIEEGIKEIRKDAFLYKPTALVLPNTFDYENINNITFVSVLIVPRHIQERVAFEGPKILHDKVYVDPYGVVYSDDKKSLVFFPRDLKIKSYSVLDGCETIKKLAFEEVVDPDPEFGVSYYGNDLMKVDLPKSLRVIEDSAFAGCHNITELKIPINVSIIGSFAFAECSLLSEVELPPSLEKLGENPFAQTTRIILPSNGLLRFVGGCLLTKDNRLLWIPKDIKNLMLPPIVSYRGKECLSYDNCLVTLDGELIWTIPEIANFEFPNSINRIGAGAFRYNRTIVKLIIPEGVIEIDCNAWNCNQALEDVYLPSTLKSIGNLKTRQGWGRKYIKFFYPKRIHIPKGMKNHFIKLLPDINEEKYTKFIEY